ncbi:MAG: hypothetical protein K6G08_08345 [Prevotella sp.]|nr:hypothetical protein [Prevotella sp.]
MDNDYNSISNVSSKEPKTKNTRKDALTSIFRISEKGGDHFKAPLSKEGQLELLMFDIWFGIQSLESRGILLDYEDTQKRIEDYLIKVIQNFGLPSEKKYERVYLLRSVTDGWEREMLGLAQSDYPRTKQYLPAYLYICFIKEPLKVYADEFLEAKIDSLNISDLADFFMVFIEHQNWLVSEFRKIK